MGQARMVTARMIWQDLKTHGPSDRYAVMARTGLTQMQFYWGLTYLRDVMQTKAGDPLVWSPKRGVYDLTTTSHVNTDEWMDWSLTYLDTRVSRMVKTREADVAKFGATKETTLELIGLRSMEATIKALLP